MFLLFTRCDVITNLSWVMRVQVPNLVLNSVNEETGQLYVHQRAVTVTDDAVAANLATHGADTYSERHGGRVPPPPGSDGTTTNYGSLHGDSTPEMQNVFAFVNKTALTLSLSRKNLDEWQARTGIRFKVIIEHGTSKLALRAGFVQKFIKRIRESRKPLLSPEVWNDSDAAVHVATLVNDWFPIHAQSRVLSSVYDFEMSKLVARTVLPLTILSQEIVRAWGNIYSITISMTHFR